MVRRRDALVSLPDAPSITPAVARYDDPAGLSRALAGVACVVHLAGILLESGATTYETANVDTTRALVAAAATAAGVRHIVFVSSLGADPGSRNDYYRSKGVAERIVAGSGVAATIIRTPLLLGPDTAGGRALVRTASQRAVKTLGGGTHVLRPLDVEDLGRALLAFCRRPTTGVTTHELVGPTPLPYRDLLARMATLLGHELSVGATPLWLAKLGAALAGLFRAGGMTPAVIDVITSSETIEHNADGDLGVRHTPLAGTLERLAHGGPASEHGA